MLFSRTVVFFFALTISTSWIPGSKSGQASATFSKWFDDSSEKSDKPCEIFDYFFENHKCQGRPKPVFPPLKELPAPFTYPTPAPLPQTTQVPPVTTSTQPPSTSLPTSTQSSKAPQPPSTQQPPVTSQPAYILNSPYYNRLHYNGFPYQASSQNIIQPPTNTTTANHQNISIQGTNPNQSGISPELGTGITWPYAGYPNIYNSPNTPTAGNPQQYYYVYCLPSNIQYQYSYDPNIQPCPGPNVMVPYNIRYVPVYPQPNYPTVSLYGAPGINNGWSNAPTTAAPTNQQPGHGSRNSRSRYQL